MAREVALESSMSALPSASDLANYRSLAYAEMYITVATIFRRFDMQLYETTYADIEPAHEYHIPQVRKESKGVQVLVK